ncbi:HD domain-containing protein [Lacrimispora sp. NSJ-141]|uniref:Stage 0 sporulation protein A homolog n=1 Tax=Lientehia hominis TaxID=2897778 RepID=A0AAP2W9K4_9FIRM|nr:HD domain-containing response regulator [Lientehia hominis]MCD2492027.1 HD domain-containing protein [Lientehia hominis]
MRRNRETAQKQISILTLDDDSIMTSTIQAYFQRSGYQVDVENDPYAAIERVRKNGYDILLLDFLMSPICGDQVVEEIRKFNPEIFIVLLTGHKSMAPPIKTIRQLDIQGYYEKSDRFDQLELLVESCVKSIRQMRTIRGYQKGLSVVVDALPGIYNLQSMEHISDGILEMVEELLPAKGSFLAFETEQKGERVPFLRMRGDLPECDYYRLFSDVEWEGANAVQKDGYLLLPVSDETHKAVGGIGILPKSEPQKEQIQLVKIFSRQASAAIYNSQLHQRVNEQNEELTQAYQYLEDGYIQTIDTLRFVVETRDIETKGHSERVSCLAAALAGEMGLEKEDVERIRVAGLFHDIGKVGVPDGILLKPGKLTDSEYDEIKKHPDAGAKILSVFRPFSDMIPIVRGHHERMDGRGYPDGLRGEEIPLGARIIAVADSFDAMISNRQYRSGLGIDRAISEIRAGRETQFDGRVVDSFLSLVEREGEEGFLKRFSSHV